MAFVMETMTEQDHARIFTPENKKLIENYCAPYYKWEPVSKRRWAIDHDRDIIFYLISAWEPRDGKRRYLLIFEGVPMVIQMTNADWKVDPIDMPDNLKPRIDEIRNAVREAFTVHGIFGLRPPTPADTPVPIFE